MTRISEIDGVEMVLIPSGEGQIGSKGGYAEEMPVLVTQTKNFYMDKYLVTNKAYKVYCDAVGKPYPTSPSWEGYPDYFENFPDYPVVNVSWWDASAYAAWAGKRLPTEEEWESGAKGGMLSATYPWGHENADGDKANYADRNTDFPWKDYLTSGGYRYTSPVGSYEANGYGLLDMAGNVWEWCDGWFHIYGSSQELSLIHI